MMQILLLACAGIRTLPVTLVTSGVHIYAHAPGNCSIFFLSEQNGPFTSGVCIYAHAASKPYTTSLHVCRTPLVISARPASGSHSLAVFRLAGTPLVSAY